MDLQSAPELIPYLVKDVHRTGTVLGMGSFGFVEEVIMNGAPCAGKKLHEVLTELGKSNKRELLKKLVHECRVMSGLKHPNIVQFFGLCFFENSEYPVIVMEKLHSSLETLLEDNDNIPLPVKIIIMQDITKGLNYIHTRAPPIVHRDLTAKNVLLTSSLKAKLADLGNARTVESNKGLTQMPGTLMYMPPEALQSSPSYDTSLDMFSFGHLMIYILLQESPKCLLAHVSIDPLNPNKVIPKTEVERRQDYISRCAAVLGESSPLMKTLLCCLSNHPKTRPAAAEVLDLLTKMEAKQKDAYEEIRSKMGANLTHMMQSSEKVERRLYEREDSEDMLAHKILLSKIKSGESMALEKLEIITQGMFKKEKHAKWTSRIFQIEESNTLRYYSDNIKKKLSGELMLSKVTEVKKIGHHFKFPFDIHFDGRDSPWHLRAPAEDLRESWMEAIKPNSTATKVSRRHNYDNCQLKSTEVLNPQNQEPHSNEKEKEIDQSDSESTDDKSQIHDDKDKKINSSIDIENFDGSIDQFDGFTDLQLEELASSLNKLIEKRKGSGNYTEVEISPANHVPKIEVVSTTDDEPKPPAIPPKKRKFQQVPKADQQEYTSPHELLPDESFRGRIGNRRQSIDRIVKYRARLTKSLAHISENEELDSPGWTTAKTSEDTKNDSEGEMALKHLNIDKSALQDLKLIGAGQFGKIFKGTLVTAEQSTVLVAVKTVQKQIKGNTTNFQRELILMSRLVHPNVVRLYGLVTQENLIVMEYVAKGDLRTYLMDNSCPVPKLVKFMMDVTMGMHYISEMGLVHRDLAARNVLVSEDEVCKVADLGELREVPKEGDKTYIVIETSKVPLRWCSPEYLAQRRCSTASDVWSYGVLMWEMANPGRLPYENFSNAEVVSMIKQGYTPTIPLVYPKDVQDIMKSCWRKAPEKRPSFLYISMLLTNVNFKKKKKGN